MARPVCDECGTGFPDDPTQPPDTGLHDSYWFTCDACCTLAPECPATAGEHDYTVVETAPVNYAGRTERYLACESCHETFHALSPGGVL